MITINLLNKIAILLSLIIFVFYCTNISSFPEEGSGNGPEIGPTKDRLQLSTPTPAARSILSPAPVTQKNLSYVTQTPKATPTKKPTPIEKIIDYYIYDPQWIRLEVFCGQNPQVPFKFFGLKETDWTMSKLFKSLRKISYEEVKHTRVMPFITAGSFYDTRTGKSVGKIISKGQIITNGVENKKGFNLVWESGKIYICSNKELLNFHKLNHRWPYTSIGGLALLLPYIENRDISSSKSTLRTAYGINKDGLLILVQYMGTVRGLQKTMSSLGAIEAVQVDSGSQGICIMRGWIPYFSGGRMKSLIIGIPSFHLYKPEMKIRG